MYKDVAVSGLLRRRSMLVVPPTRRATIGDRAFPNAASRARNSRPASVREIQSVVTACVPPEIEDITVCTCVNAAGDTGDMSPATFGLPGKQYLWFPADHRHSEHQMTSTFRTA